jgi:hypothetical protein
MTSEHKEIQKVHISSDFTALLGVLGIVGKQGDGGRGGIRTHERREPLPVFKTGALNHSATLPR